MLFINNHQTQFGKLDIFLKQGMRSDHQMGAAIPNHLFRCGASFTFLLAGKPGHI
ncbi:Uncharacterised protein [Mycobacteroides abscessus]|nr:Uncharacterised protein [Mycobacteroides abscessus]